MPIRIVIETSGGVIQQITTNATTVQVIVVDYDIDGADPMDLHTTKQGSDFLSYRDPIVIDPDYVGAIFDLTDEE